jgi:hypothetical protein
MVAAEAGLNVADQLQAPGQPQKVEQQKAADPADDLESRLAALRR